jgi:K+-transporting ATPase ATPase A chain
VLFAAPSLFATVTTDSSSGARAAKPITPSSAGTLPTTGVLFIALLIGVIVIVGGITFLPALTLGPVAEHFAMTAGLLF